MYLYSEDYFLPETFAKAWQDFTPRKVFGIGGSYLGSYLTVTKDHKNVIAIFDDKIIPIESIDMSVENAYVLEYTDNDIMATLRATDYNPALKVTQ